MVISSKTPEPPAAVRTDSQKDLVDFRRDYSQREGPFVTLVKGSPFRLPVKVPIERSKKMATTLPSRSSRT